MLRIASTGGIRRPVRLSVRSPQRVATEQSHRDTHRRQNAGKKQCEQDSGIDPSHRLRNAPPETIRDTQRCRSNEPQSEQKRPDNEQGHADRRMAPPPDQGRRPYADAADASSE